MKKTLALCVSFAFLPLAAYAMNGTDIAAKAYHASYYQGDSGRSRVRMEITDKQDRKRTRDFVILRKDIGEGDGAQKFYVYFNRPADVSETVFMVWKNDDKDDDERWLYLPGLDLVKRIAASDERTSFVGSDFFYEDVSGRNLSEDTHELLETTDNYYVLKSTPNKPEAVEFSYFKCYVHKESFIPVKIEFYDKRGEKYRESVAHKVETIQGNPTVTHRTMKNLRSGSQTVLNYSNVKYDIDMLEDVFTERYLRQPPMSILKK